MLEDMKKLKKDYKNKFGEIKEIKNQLLHIQSGIEQKKHNLVTEFEAWWDETIGGIGKDLDDEDDVEVDPEDPDSGAFFKAKKTVKQLHKGKVKPPTKRK